MKTRLFGELLPLDTEFAEDVRQLWGLKPEQRLQLIPLAIELISADGPDDAQVITERAVAEIGAAPDLVWKSLSVLDYLGSQWDSTRESTKDCIEDLIVLNLIPEGQEQEGADFLQNFFKALDSQGTKLSEREFSNAMLPSFSGVSALVDMRAVFRRLFDKRVDSVEEYSPELISWVPVALISLARDFGEPRSFEFQCSAGQLRRLIEGLLALEKELGVAIAKFSQGDGQ